MSYLTTSNPLVQFAMEIGSPGRLIKWIKHSEITTPDQLIELSSSELRNIRGIGTGTILALEDLQRDLCRRFHIPIPAKLCESPKLPPPPPSPSDPGHLYLLAPLRVHCPNRRMLKLATKGNWRCLADVAIHSLSDLRARRNVGTATVGAYRSLLSRANAKFGVLPFQWGIRPEEDASFLSEHDAALRDAGRRILLEKIRPEIDEALTIEEILTWASLKATGNAHIALVRFGFGSEPTSLAEIGRWHGLTRERIRQHEKDILDVLANVEPMLRELRSLLSVASAFASPPEDIGPSLEAKGLSKCDFVSYQGACHLLRRLYAKVQRAETTELDATALQEMVARLHGTLGKTRRPSSGPLFENVQLADSGCAIDHFAVENHQVTLSMKVTTGSIIRLPTDLCELLEGKCFSVARPSSRALISCDAERIWGFGSLVRRSGLQGQPIIITLDLSNDVACITRSERKPSPPLSSVHRQARASVQAKIK